jgi:hyperosmotically inducible protein
MTIFVLGASLTAMPAMAGTPDGMLTSQVKLTLWTTAGVRSTSVHVDTNDGIVTLYGKVPTGEQKATAEKAAAEIGGVRSVKNLLQVVPEAQEKAVARSDKETQDAAEKLLKADPRLKDSAISVKSVDKGVVLLTGSATTYMDHLRAIVIIDRMPGVRRVATEVKGPEGFSSDERITFLNRADYKGTEQPSKSSDMRISTMVKLRLLTTAQVPSSEISVDSEDGVVTLFGMVPTVGVKNAATAEARKVSGVTGVQNQLEVVATSQKKFVEAKDADIAKDLTLTLKDRAEFKSVETAVKNGTVRLTGTVGSGWDEVNVVRVVRNVAGVRGVEDNIKIDPKETSQR